MEIRNTPSVQRIILRPLQPTYKAASASRITHRPFSHRSLLKGTDQSQSWISSSAFVVRLTHTRSLYRACIIMYLKYPGHRRRHNTGKPTSTPISSFFFLTISLYFITGGSNTCHLTDSLGVQLHTLTQRLFLLRNPFTEARQRRRATGGPNNFV